MAIRILFSKASMGKPIIKVFKVICIFLKALWIINVGQMTNIYNNIVKHIYSKYNFFIINKTDKS